VWILFIQGDLQMSKITYIDHNNVARTVEAPEGLSLMEAALQNMIPGIDGDCGGNCACATCRVDVNEEWMRLLPPVSPEEQALLNIIDSKTPQSRLACQLKATPELSGIVVHTPSGQH
jgi:2Fe-2S ferredoxin